MSSIFSDPPFRRGTTLLGGEAIELDAAGNPIAGVEIVGQVKAFQDVHPSTGQRYSNRLVYCMAARYRGNLVSDVTTLTGRAFQMSPSAPLTEFSALADNTISTAGGTIAILDEYLTGELRPNDIVWLVLKGPVTVGKTAGAAITGAAAVQLHTSNGVVAPVTTGTPVATQIAASVSGVVTPGGAASADTLTRINLWSDRV